MYINLRCAGCGEAAPVSFESLYSIWKPRYDMLGAEQKKRPEFVARKECRCGHLQRYDGIMFKYGFGLIFEAFVNG